MSKLINSIIISVFLLFVLSVVIWTYCVLNDRTISDLFLDSLKEMIKENLYLIGGIIGALILGFLGWLIYRWLSGFRGRIY